ncbi:hypothetical protein B0H14DRAFT_2792119 [Mycena olivaceomarginata]|nr:hypothetical protein B0H14DRAFT_2792119 [Mycena olivaceomarginata]
MGPVFSTRAVFLTQLLSAGAVVLTGLSSAVVSTRLSSTGAVSFPLSPKPTHVPSAIVPALSACTATGATAIEPNCAFGKIHGDPEKH